MQRTTFCLLFFAVALALIWAECNSSMGCERCFLAHSAHCARTSLADAYRVGSADEPQAFRTLGFGWGSTSSGFSAFGEPASLTWSIVPDGTGMPRGQGEPATPSNLIAFLDGIHHGGPGPGESDLTQRAWFALIKSAFDRWDAVSGVEFSYEPKDDGVVNGMQRTALGSARGILGVRGDHRLGGHSIDGQVSPTIVAYNYFPPNSDTVLDTDELARFGNPSEDYLRFRNTLMHEIGHGLGLDHVSSAGNNFLMEALLDVSIDGPQFDDILGIHRLYGDRFEENGGNDLPSSATLLGSFVVGQSISLGRDAVDAMVAPTEEDFVSINMLADSDYFKFTVSQPGMVDILLTPVGPTYPESFEGGEETPYIASALNDLSLFLFNGSGTNQLTSSVHGGLGESERIRNFMLTEPGEYLIRIAGAQDAAQFYQLDLAVVPEPATLLLILVALAGWAARRPYA